jgi:hypothetical protein
MQSTTPLIKAAPVAPVAPDNTIYIPTFCCINFSFSEYKEKLHEKKVNVLVANNNGGHPELYSTTFNIFLMIVVLYLYQILIQTSFSSLLQQRLPREADEGTMSSSWQPVHVHRLLFISQDDDLGTISTNISSIIFHTFEDITFKIIVCTKYLINDVCFTYEY